MPTASPSPPSRPDRGGDRGLLSREQRHTCGVRDFVEKTVQFLREGIHVLLVDLFPPTPRDPQGLHKVIWDEIGDEPFEFPPGKDRTLVSYETADDRIAYIEPVAVGDRLRDMPLFLSRGSHVPVPLESTYLATWT